MTPRAEQPRILIVEDDLLILELMKEVLEGHGFVVDCYPDGQQALSWLRTSKEQMPQLILLDLMMPVLDGFGLMEQLKQDPIFSRIPVIAISADEKGREITRKTIAKTFLRKPVKIELLIETINRFVTNDPPN